jgi:separase
MEVGDILYGDSVNTSFQQSFERYYREAIARVAKCATSVQDQSHSLMPSGSEFITGLSLNKQIELRNVRNLIDSTGPMDEATEASVCDLCYSVENSELSSPDDKAWALNYLGSIEIEKARKSGALQLLWSDPLAVNSTRTDQNIRQAREYLYRASLSAFDSSDIFARSVSRNLALALGPLTHDEQNLPSAGILVLSSTGQSLRRKMTWSLLNTSNDRLDTRQNRCGSDRNWFAVFDSPERSNQKSSNSSVSILLDELADLVPSNWKFVAPVLCPSGDVLITCIEKKSQEDERFTISTKCVLHEGDVHAYDNILKPLDSILVRLQNQLHGTTVIDDDNKEEQKRNWWDERGRLDDELYELLHTVESMYFPTLVDCDDRVDRDDSVEAEIHTSVHSGSSISSDEDSGIFPRGNLASRFDAVLNDVGKADTSDFSDDQEDLSLLTVPKIKERLVEYGVQESDLKRKKKAALLEMLVGLQNQNLPTLESPIMDEREGSVRDQSTSDSSDGCLFLILDENLHRFPFEGMPRLMGRTVCRVPCLSFVLTALHENQPDRNSQTVRYVDPSNTNFVLDPENNLLGTRQRLLPVLRDITRSRDWNWGGVIGKIPSPEFFSRALTAPHSMLLYFGHGGAQSCFSRRRVEELIDGRVEALRGVSHGDCDSGRCDGGEGAATEDRTSNGSACKAVVVLMGCSSGRLVSVNRKNTDMVEEAPLYYEPEGVALSYLCAGAPCVVGNLWDVTDHDIDRFSVSMLDHFLGGGVGRAEDETINRRNESTTMGTGTSLATSVALSRSACKLRYLVGCAPVCYGIPVCLLRDASSRERRRIRMIER